MYTNPIAICYQIYITGTQDVSVRHVLSVRLSRIVCAERADERIVEFLSPLVGWYPHHSTVCMCRANEPSGSVYIGKIMYGFLYVTMHSI